MRGDVLPHLSGATMHRLFQVNNGATGESHGADSITDPPRCEWDLGRILDERGRIAFGQGWRRVMEGHGGAIALLQVLVSSQAGAEHVGRFRASEAPTGYQLRRVQVAICESKCG